MTNTQLVKAETGLFFTEEQRRMIRTMYAAKASDSEFEVLMEIAKTRRLNPLLGQVHFVPRGGKWAVQVSIDGLRGIAQRTGLYAGQDAPEWVERETGKGPPTRCTVKVYRKDWDRPAVGVAYWEEYAVQGGAFWTKMPHVMLAKVAESLALRKAFPEEMSALYSDDEMGQAGSELMTQGSWAEAEALGSSMSGPTPARKAITVAPPAKKVTPYDPDFRPMHGSDGLQAALDAVEEWDDAKLKADLGPLVSATVDHEEEKAIVRGALAWRASVSAEVRRVAILDRMAELSRKEALSGPLRAHAESITLSASGPQHAPGGQND